MSDLLSEILAGLEQINPSDLREPEEEVVEGEKIVGELDEVHRKLFELRRILRDKAEIAVSNHKAISDFDVDEDARKAARLDANKAIARMKFVNDLFWTSVRLTHGLLEEESVIVRQGWKVGAAHPCFQCEAWIDGECMAGLTPGHA